MTMTTVMVVVDDNSDGGDDNFGGGYNGGDGGDNDNNEDHGSRDGDNWWWWWLCQQLWWCIGLRFQRILKDFLLFYKKFLWYSIRILNSINKSCGIQLRLLRFFKEENKIWWYSVMIFYNYKSLLVLKNIQISMDCFLGWISMNFINLFNIKHLSNNLTQTLEILLDFIFYFSISYQTFFFSLITHTFFSL